MTDKVKEILSLTIPEIEIGLFKNRKTPSGLMFSGNIKYHPIGE